MNNHTEKPNNGQNKPGDLPRDMEKKMGKLSRNQKILVAVAAVLVVVLVITLAWRAVFVKPELPQKTDLPDSSVEETDYGDGIRPRSDGTRKSADYYTILVMGRDTGGGGNTDTMMLASYDVTNQKLTVMNIPRDTMVNVPWDIKRINSVYNYYGGGERGIQKVYQEVSQLVGFEPDYQVIVEWEAVGKLVDAIGGVYFDVPRNMNYDDPYQDLSIHINKGYQLLDGEQAMGVIRYRHDNNMRYGYANGDLGRIETQQAFLKAVIQQLLQVKNLGKINQFAKIFQENVETDLSVQNLFWFGKSAIMGGLSMDNVNFVTMPNTPRTCYSRTYGNNQSYVVPNANELLKLVNEELSPFIEPSVLSDLDIMSVNSDGSVSSTTGHVEDSRAAAPPVRETDTKEPETDENGNLIDPDTGMAIDPNTGLPVTPEGGDGTGGNQAGTVTNPDGTVTNPDGSITNPDGAAPNPDGTTPAPDGSGTGTPDQGIVVNPDGSITYPDGTIVPGDQPLPPNSGTAEPAEPAEPVVPEPVDPAVSDTGEGIPTD